MEQGARPTTATSDEKSVPVDSTGRPNRSLPPWIDSYDVRYGAPPDEQLRLLNRPPPRAVPPQHNNTPAPLERRVSRDGYIDWDAPLEADDDDGKHGKKKRGPVPSFVTRRRDRPGRKWDHMRSAEPVVMTGYMARNAESPWHNFVQASQYGHAKDEDAEVVDSEEFEKLQPGFNANGLLPSYLVQDQKRSKRQRTKALYTRVWNVILKHPMVPAFLRLTVLFVSIISLSLASAMIHSHGGDNAGPVDSQSIVSIVVDVLAIPYVFYMTWDEYFGKPLGLRSARQKISLTLMDLFFIIFKSASATLAFETLAYDIPSDSRLKALASFELIGLIGWIMNFTINIYRLVSKLGYGDGPD